MPGKQRHQKRKRLGFAVLAAATLGCASAGFGQILQSRRGYADTGASYGNTQATGAGWYYNWGIAPSNVGNYNATFIPMIWGSGQSADSNINYALSQASTYVLGFNEPERSDQANLTVAQATSIWDRVYTDKQAYNSSIQLISPAVADTGAGQAWLQSFMATESSKVNAIAFHWYDDDTTNGTQAASDFESRVASYHNTYNKPIFITEFADHDWGGTFSQASMIAANTQMLSIVVPWLNSQSYVAGYSWYNWFGDSALFNGSTPMPTTLGYPYDGSVGTGTTADISATNLGEHVAFLTGGTLTMTTTAGTIKYINALSGTSTVTGSINWGLNSSSSSNWVQIQSGGTLLKSGTNTITFQNGTMTNNGVLQVAQGVLQLSSISSSGTGSVYISSDGGAIGSTARIELLGGAAITNPITYAQRTDPGNSDGIRNVTGNNTISGPITITVGGNQTRFQSDAGLLTISGAVTTNATSTRSLYLQGAGNAVISGVISNNASNSAGLINLTKQGTGTWTLSNNNTYTGTTTISGGTLQLMNTVLPLASYSFSPGTVSGNTVTNAGLGGSALNATFSASGGTGSVTTSGGPLAGTGALVLNGNGSVLTVNSGITSLANTSNWTISAWVKTTQPGFTILNKSTSGSSWGASNSTFYLGVQGQSGGGSGGTPVAVRYGGGWMSGTTTPAVNNGAWHLVTYTDNGSTETVYVDGTAETTTQGFGNGDIGNFIRFGSGAPGENDGQAVSSGSIGAINIYSSALSAAQIQALYASNNTVVAMTNILPSTTPVALTASSAVFDLEGVNQTVATLTGPAGSALILGLNSKLTISNTSEFDGSVTGNGGINQPNAGTFTLGGSNIAYTGSTTIGSGASFNISASSIGGIVTRLIGAVTITGTGKLTLAPAASGATRQLLVLPSLNNNGGRLDLANNDMIVQNAGPAGLAPITTQIQQGYNGGTWQGTTGITSSIAASRSDHLTALGAIQNDNGFGTALYATFDGTPVTDADVLTKYTYYGDSNLDGKVDGSDYTRIDNGYLAALTGWFNGDYNYDGSINGSDYTLIDNTFNMQGAILTTQFATQTAQIAGASSVPEPAMMSIFAFSTTAMLRRRRDRRM